MFKLVVLVALLACAAALPRKSKVPRLDGRIVGGRDVEIEDFPYQISLLWFGSHICGGSIISPRWVITAAHCTDGGTASQFSIRAGSSIRDVGGQIRQVGEIHQHHKFDSVNVDFDITVLMLTVELDIGPGVDPVHLPVQHQPIIPGTMSAVSGWGALTEGGPSPTQLQAVDVPVVSQEECRAAYGAAITDRMMCAGVPEGGKDACQGDSGGPLVIEGQVIGIVSWGYGCARPSFPGVYSSVPTLRRFVLMVTGI